MLLTFPFFYPLYLNELFPIIYHNNYSSNNNDVSMTTEGINSRPGDVTVARKEIEKLSVGD
jgi:hypothetical protein